MPNSKNSNRSQPLKEKLGGRNLYLIGMMGSGKTSTGKPLAEALGYGFVDCDQVIEKLVGKSIGEMFAQEGEKHFREIESKVLSSIGQLHSLVVATGGGIVTLPENWGILHQGIVIWLDPTHERLLTRLKTDRSQRPLLNTGDLANTLTSLMNKRTACYAEADIRVLVQEETTKEVALKILEAIPQILRNPEDLNGPQTTAG